MNELLLVVSIAGRDVALRADQVQSVIELEGLSPVPRAPDHIAGLSALRSRVLTVIDCRRAIGLSRNEDGDAILNAAVVEHEGHPYALLVDDIVDVIPAMSEPSPLRARLGKGWEAIGKGMIETSLGPILLVDVPALVGGSAQARAA